MNTLKKLKPVLISLSFFAVVAAIVAVVNMRHNDLGYWGVGGELFLLVVWFILYFALEGEEDED